ncbi:MAG TPA: FxsA family protein [Solirubrobacterales bacterium]|nr:FxsA family protein [Solirubrobacterales bacterium]
MFLLVLLFVVVPILELYVIIQVGEAIGLWPTLLLLLLDAVAGSLLLRHQGRGAWRRFNEALAQRRFPGKEVADGVLIVIGGTLLLAPGFLTDVVGVFLLIPPTRALARALLRRFTIGRFTVVGVGGLGGFGRGPGGPRDGANRPYDFDVSAEDMPVNGNGASHELPRVDED